MKISEVTISKLKTATPWMLAAALLALLLVLASLQVRWLDAVSRADRDRTRAVLQSAATRFAEDFDRELTRAFLYLQPYPRGSRTPDGTGYAERWEQWLADALFPQLVRGVFRLRWNGTELRRFDPRAGEGEASPWPAELDDLKQRLERTLKAAPEGRPDPAFSLLADTIPALIIPLHPGPQGLPPYPRGFAVIWLDLRTITEDFLPRLAARHLTLGDGTDYVIRIDTVDTGEAIYPSGSPTGGKDPEEEAHGSGDASARLFALLPADKLGSLAVDLGRPGLISGQGEADRLRRSGDRRLLDRPDRAGGPGRRGRRFGGRFDNHRARRLYSFVSQGKPGRWRLRVTHPAGSLDAAVARARWSDLAVSFSILLVLAASVALMFRSTRRAQALARQQLEFVAGVTHELLTPLAAMRSAGQNLADGVVDDPDRVRRYGRLIDGEGRRLSTMVEQVLEFAGIQAGRRSYVQQRIAVPEVIAEALAEYRPVLEELGFEVDTAIDDDLPEALADPAALRRALQNLIGNAVKHGASGAWVGVSARRHAGSHGQELHIAVEDRGPGIHPADLPHVFEPFYRGRNGTRDQIPGGGLGLSLVQHIVEGHGGRIEVESSADRGSRFVICLPAADPEEVREHDS